MRHAKKFLTEKYEMVMGSIIKHGPILDRVVGDKIQNYKIIRKEFLRQQKEVRILRSEKVDELYGKEALQYYSQNEVERKALSEGREIIVRQGYVLKVFFLLNLPLIA